MLLLVALAHADDTPVSPTVGAKITLPDHYEVEPPVGDLVDGRRYTDAAWMRLPSGRAGEGAKLPEGTTRTGTPLHTERLDTVPARDLLGVVGMVPGMLSTRTGVVFSDGAPMSLYVDGIRWDRAGRLGR